MLLYNSAVEGSAAADRFLDGGLVELLFGDDPHQVQPVLGFEGRIQRFLVRDLNGLAPAERDLVSFVLELLLSDRLHASGDVRL